MRIVHNGEVPKQRIVSARDKRIIRARARGESYKNIASKEGISKQGVAKSVAKTTQMWGEGKILELMREAQIPAWKRIEKIAGSTSGKNARVGLDANKFIMEYPLKVAEAFGGADRAKESLGDLNPERAQIIINLLPPASGQEQSQDLVVGREGGTRISVHSGPARPGANKVISEEDVSFEPGGSVDADWEQAISREVPSDDGDVAVRGSVPVGHSLPAGQA